MYLLIPVSLLLWQRCAGDEVNNAHEEGNQDAVHGTGKGTAPLLVPIIRCNDSLCYGTYIGPEFVLGDDVAHQFSNAMCWEVGDQLKRLYAEGKYCKVDLKHIRMRTKGMGTGAVTYSLLIPFVRVEQACEARTSFDHCGGWDHPPQLEERKRALKNALLPGNHLEISRLYRTPEGLQEYWIQWRNKEVQADCGHR